MNITKESTGNLTAKITIELEPADYQEKVDKTLRDYQKNANIPGFRPGKVPFGLVKKMYGKALTYDTVNKLFSESLYKYLIDEKTDTIGQPIPAEDNQPIDLDTEPEKISYSFDIGLSPEFTLPLDADPGLNRFKITVDDAGVDKYIREIRQRNGNYAEGDEVGENDMVYGEFTELGNDGTPRENGIKNSSFIYMEYVADEATKNRLLGMKPGDALEIDPHKAGKSPEEAGYLLGIKKENIESVGERFEFKIQKISRMTPADLNEDLYKKVYPNEEITDFEAFRERIRMDASAAYFKETERKLMNDCTEYLIDNTAMELPDEFLKRFLFETRTDEKSTREQIEGDYPRTRRMIVWQLIENKLASDHGLRVDRNETREFIKGYFRGSAQNADAHQHHDHDHDHDHEHEHEHENTEDQAESRLNQIAETIMKNEEEVRRINEKLFDDKLMKFFENTFKIGEKEISYDDFIASLSQTK